MKINRSLLLLLTFLAFLTATASTQEKASQSNGSLPYRNSSLAIGDRVADLLSRMTLEEKIDQICGGGRQNVSVIDPTGTFTDESARATLSRWWDPDQAFPPRGAAILRNGIQ